MIMFRPAVIRLLTCCVLVLSLHELDAAVVVLRDGKEIEGRIRSQDARLVVVQAGRRTWQLPRSAVIGVYEDKAALAKARKTDIRFTIRNPLPTIDLTTEKRVRALVDSLLQAPDATARQALRNKAGVDAELLPPAQVISTWLQRSELKKPAKRRREPTPWLAGNERALALVTEAPGYDCRKKPWPVIITLHGTEDKPDNIHALMQAAGKAGCFVIAPRTTSRSFWQNPTEIQNIYRLLGHLANRYRIDPRRIVICGGSGGGMGTWAIAANHPELFCCAGSFAGMPGIRVEQVPRFKGVPLRLLHGDKDHIPVSGPRRMVAEMKRLNIEHIYVEYKGDHFPPEKLKKEWRDWLQIAPPKKGHSPRPALLGFMKEAAQLMSQAKAKKQ